MGSSLGLHERKEGALMKRLLIIMISISFLIVPSMVYAQSEQTAANVPPAVSQPLVPEGDFALKLVSALKLGTADNEAQAEDMLTSAGIAPRNGWIADYPVTPDIIGELQDAVTAAADSQKLPMEKKEALNAFQNLIAEFGLAVSPGDSDQYAESQPQPDATIINNYYNEEGPPVVTYYPPPPDYYYLYAWVPYPFWYSGFSFPGYFILHDFHRVVFIHKKKYVFTNHVFDHKTRRVFTIDPVRRFARDGFRMERDGSHGRRFDTREAKRGAESIFERSMERRKSGIYSPSRGPGEKSEREISRNHGGKFPFNGRNEGLTRDSPPDKEIYRDKTESVSPGLSERTFSRPGNLERQDKMNSREPSVREGRFSNARVRGVKDLSAPLLGIPEDSDRLMVSEDLLVLQAGRLAHLPKVNSAGVVEVAGLHRAAPREEAAAEVVAKTRISARISG